MKNYHPQGAQLNHSDQNIELLLREKMSPNRTFLY